MLIKKLSKYIQIDCLNVSSNAYFGTAPDLQQTSFSLLQYLKLKTYKCGFFLIFFLCLNANEDISRTCFVKQMPKLAHCQLHENSDKSGSFGL